METRAQEMSTRPDDTRAGPEETRAHPQANSAESHERTVLVWDVPAAIARGETFRVKAGIKCSLGCKPVGWTIEIRDHEGRVVGTATTGDEPWPGTSALRFAEIELAAPEQDGLYAWEAIAPAATVDEHAEGAQAPVADLPIDRPLDEDGACHSAAPRHGTARAAFNVRVAPPPEWRVTVVALDKESGAPVKGATVVAHPYRTLTDDRGVAVLRVPKGACRLFVSGQRYFPFRWDGEVTADVTLTAELERDREPSDAEIWA